MNRMVRIDAFSIAAGWVAVSAASVLAGWGLSLAGWLSPRGYGGVSILILAGAAILAWRYRRRIMVRLRGRRWRRLWPAVFLLSWSLAVAGGIGHPPNNIDTMAYRLPRVLHWLAAGGWHWIDTVDPRLNYSACGQEWLMMPVISLTGSDRWTWVWNALSYALLPGLIFVTLIGLGVARRMAWRWMWLLPLAPIYLLQAGSVANDLLGTAYFLAALAWMCRAGREGPRAFVVSMFALALATGIKSSNIVLGLPWLALAWPRLAREPIVRRAALVWLLPVALVSALPTLALNRYFTGDWTGDPANVTAVKAGSVASGLAGNAVQAVLQNLQPPIFPVAELVEARLADSLGTAMQGWLAEDFPRFSIHLTELAQEEWAGLGGLMVLLMLGVWSRREPDGGKVARRPEARIALWGGLAAAIIFFAVMGSEMTARLLAPWYPLAAAAVLTGGWQKRWSQSRAFVCLAVLTALGSLVPLVISPARPLVSVQALLRMSAPMERVAAGVIARAEVLYEVYAHRSDFLHELCRSLPAEVQVVGFMATADDTEVSLWRPFGQRRVETVRSGDSVEDLRARGIAWVAVRTDAMWPKPGMQAEWLAAHDAEVKAALSVRSKAHRPKPEEWVLVRVKG